MKKNKKMKKIIAKEKLGSQIVKKKSVSSNTAKRKKEKKSSLKTAVTRKELERKIQTQKKEIKVRNGQIKRGASREKISDLKIEEQREELLHVTRVGKLAEFVSSLAHEISQPLTAILSYAQAAQRMFAGREPELQEILQFIINDNQRATEVIRRLRLLLKKSHPVFETLNISTLINDTIELVIAHITVRHTVVKLKLDKDLPPTQGDRIQLQQVLLNLISNSLEAMEENSDPREMLIRTSRKDIDTIVVEINDSGCGIPEENKKKLFKHFFTSKPDGLGMGLSISRSIVNAHGGQLEAENNPDRGATFYFTLPILNRKSPGTKES